MQTRRLTILGFIVAAALIVAPAADAATTFDVNVNIGAGANLPDATPGDGFCATTAFQCTLRAAIQESNATAGGAPYRIRFLVPSVPVPTTLPPITRSGTFIDGCDVDRSTPTGPPNTPAAVPCVSLISTGALTGIQVGDQTSNPSGVAIQNLALTNFQTRAIRVWGADGTRIGGNFFGVRTDGVNPNGTLVEPNGTAISITGRTQGGALVNPALRSIVGGPSVASDACGAYCNKIVGSSTTPTAAGAGIDLVGTPSSSGDADAPAGGDAGQALDGTTIAGNWIGVRDAAGTALPNAVAIKIGDAQETLIGGPDADDANVIAGNTEGVSQGNGATAVTLLGGSYGISPDGNTSVPNGSWNAQLHGGGFGLGPFVQGVTFGPAAIGLEIDGSYSNVLGSAFLSPQDGATFGTAAIKLGQDADRAFIGSNTGSTPVLCFASVTGTCNVIGDTAPGAPGIWVNGADDASILRTSIGFLPAAPLDGPPIRIDGAATGAIIGDDDDAALQNKLVRQSGPAVEIGGTASNIVIAGNAGLSVSQFDLPGGLFTDILPDPGPGNSGPVNGGIQAPVITQASADGVGGTAIPGATIRVLVQQRAPVVGDPDPASQGETYPSTPAVTTANAAGVWGISFDTPLKVGNKLLASQTTADGSSEYATPQAATATNSPPLVTFTGGPPTVVDTAVRSATFSFTSNKAGSTFTCSLDAGTFVPCTSPYTVNGLETGGHQLQVKATDPIGKQGPPASRNWSILFPLTTPPSSPPVAASAAVRFASVVSLPSARSCISKRSMRITVHTPKGSKIKSVVIRIAGRKVGSAKKAKTIPISLKGLRRGTFVVKVEVTLSDGHVVKGSRTYRTCAKKASKKKSRR